MLMHKPCSGDFKTETQAWGPCERTTGDVVVVDGPLVLGGVDAVLKQRLALGAVQRRVAVVVHLATPDKCGKAG